MKTPSTLICAAALASLTLIAPGCSKKSSSYSSTVATSTSASTTVINTSTTATPTSAAPATPPVAAAPSNTGTGVFIDGSGALPDSSSYDFSVTSGDFDGDGDVDLMIAVHQGASRILENNGGNFTVKVGAFPDLVTRATDAHAVDVDKDGDLDIVLASNMQPIRVFKNDGTGTFTLSGTFLSTNDTFTYRIAVADFNGDGYADIFMGNSGLNTTSRGQNRLLLNDTSGAFKEATAGSVPVRDDDTIGIVALDFDKDGDMDVFTANFGSPHRLLVNDGQGTFTDQTDSFLPPLTSYGTCAVSADFNGDGYADIFVGNEGPALASAPPQGERNLLLLGSASGRFIDASPTIPSQAEATFDLAAADFDGDGAPDLAASTLRGVQRLMINDSGRLDDATPNFPLTNATPSDSLAVEAADFNGDGAIDLIFLQRRAKPFLFLNVPRTPAPAAAASPTNGVVKSPI